MNNNQKVNTDSKQEKTEIEILNELLDRYPNDKDNFLDRLITAIEAGRFIIPITFQKCLNPAYPEIVLNHWRFSAGMNCQDMIDSLNFHIELLKKHFHIESDNKPNGDWR